jgi:hypothetical protein
METYLVKSAFPLSKLPLGASGYPGVQPEEIIVRVKPATIISRFKNFAFIIVPPKKNYFNDPNYLPPKA